jgi:hypothetical protein
MTRDRAQCDPLFGHCVFSALGVAAHVAGPVAPGIRAPDHDISPPVQDQLVLKLEVWVLGAKRPDVLPGRGSCRLSLPLYQNLVHAAGQSKSDCSFRHRSNCAVMQERQRRWFLRRHPLELLEQSHMKHVVDAGAGRQSQSDNDFIDELGDAIWPYVMRLELAGDSLGQ